MFNSFYSQFGYNLFLYILRTSDLLSTSTSFTSKHWVSDWVSIFFGTVVHVSLIYFVLFVCGRTFSIPLQPAFPPKIYNFFVCFIKRSTKTIALTKLLTLFYYLVRLKLWFWLGRFWFKAQLNGTTGWLWNVIKLFSFVSSVEEIDEIILRLVVLVFFAAFSEISFR